MILTACGSDTPPEPLSVGGSSDPAMRVAAEIYAGALARAGTPASTRDVPVGDDRVLLDALAVGTVDLFPAYSRTALAVLSPEPLPDPTAPEAAADVAARLARSLPPGTAVGDPTLVTDPAAGELMPIFRAALLDKAALKALSRVAGDLTTVDLAAMAERARAGEDPRAIAADWLSSRSG